MKCECGGEQEIRHGLLFRMWFVCKACGRPMGFNQAVVRAAFPIQQLPPGAVPVYFGKDPDITELVMPDDDPEPDPQGNP